MFSNSMAFLYYTNIFNRTYRSKNPHSCSSPGPLFIRNIFTRHFIIRFCSTNIFVCLNIETDLQWCFFFSEFAKFFRAYYPTRFHVRFRLVGIFFRVRVIFCFAVVKKRTGAVYMVHRSVGYLFVTGVACGNYSRRVLEKPKNSIRYRIDCRWTWR